MAQPPLPQGQGKVTGPKQCHLVPAMLGSPHSFATETTGKGHDPEDLGPEQLLQVWADVFLSHSQHTGKWNPNSSC